MRICKSMTIPITIKGKEMNLRVGERILRIVEGKLSTRGNLGLASVMIDGSNTDTHNFASLQTDSH
jgi:hypothetical protein